MERGAVALHSNLRIHSSLPRWPLLSRSRSTLRPSGDSRRPRRTSRCSPAELLHVEHFRSYICSKGKGHWLVQKALHKSHTSLRAFNSCGPQEANLNSEEMTKDKLLIDCGTDQECVLGGIVALGKFDALHIGHRELAIQASKAGVPFLLSFVGIAEVLGWETRAPIVANCDRKRVLSSWAPHCCNVVPLEFQVKFSNVRHLTPRQFVERLSKELRVSGVVAGENYRFGYKASGDATLLVRLCNEYGLAAYIVNPVMDKAPRSYNGAGRSINSSDRGQVSSSRVRHALAMGDTEYVAELLGRKHRLVLMVDQQCLCTNGRISAPVSCMLNQPPVDGAYDRCTFIVGDAFVGPCKVVLNAETISIELVGGSVWPRSFDVEDRLVGIEFG